MLLKNKVAIITGAASLKGIGWATAKRFADEGARIAVLDLDPKAAQSAVAEIGSAHRGYACDVRSEEQCVNVVKSVLAEFGQIDILVNNAGVAQPTPLMQSSIDDFNLVMDVSLRGTFNMSRAVVPHFKSRSTGNILCMGSIAAQRGGGVLGGPHYAAAKGGVQTLARAMARELGPSGIRVNAVAPGLIETELLVGKISDEKKKMVAENTPLGRLGFPEEIANVFLFLASDLSSYVTGVVLDVNGGMHIH